MSDTLFTSALLTTYPSKKQVPQSALTAVDMFLCESSDTEWNVFSRSNFVLAFILSSFFSSYLSTYLATSLSTLGFT